MTALDAMVAGGGPAGSAAAITLARAGWRVRLWDHGRTAAPLGQSLPPAARRLLQDLGAPDDHLAAHLPAWGRQSLWGSPRLQIQDSLSDPEGHGWHLDRDRFDRQLRDLAAAAGAEIRLGRMADDAKTPWLIDATGRSARFARARGAVARVVDSDRLVAFSLSFADRERDGTTLVEAVPEGWWYTARLPGGRRIAVFLTDRDLPAAREARTRAGFAALLERTQEVHRRLQGYREDGGAPRAHAAATRILAPVAGPGWIAVGDAALTTDPLAAQGVLTALYSGLLAGRALAAGGGQEELLAAYPTALQSVFDAHRRHRALYYQQEKRFAGEPFWQRRQIQIE